MNKLLSCLNSIRASKRVWFSPSLQILLFCFGLSFYKLYLLEINSRVYLACQWCVATKAVVYELQSIMLVGTLHLLAGFPRWRILRFILRLTVVGVLIVTTIDLVILQQFLMRFTLDELIKFISEFNAITSFLQQLFSGFWRALLAIAGLLMVVLIFSRYLSFDRVTTRRPMLLACLMVGLVGADWAKPVEFHTPYLQGSIEAFFYSRTRDRAYSERFQAAVPSSSTKEKYCFEGEGARPNLILLVFESLSMHHSALFSGINNWVPQFDSISQKGRRLSNFYANAYDTEQGLIALLTGEPPIAKGIEHTTTIFDQFRNPVDSVPRMLQGLGYHTVFLTTGNLGFLDKGAWLKDIGFDYTEGHDASHYQGMKRFLFSAAPDDALYERAFQKLSDLQHQKKTPFFMILETVTTHHPYIDPTSGAHSQELAFRYADRQLGIFVNNLKSHGFFDNGYLMIVGDHRAMVPVSKAEIAHYGDRAYARIPFTIIGSGLNGQEELTNFSQSDLLPSLRHWLGRGKACVGPDQGIFLPTAIHSPGCIFTLRSYNVDNVFIHCGIDDYTVNLNGDSTRYVGARTGTPELLEELHRLRLGRGF